MNAPKVAVVGASGFIGHHVCVALRDRGCLVVPIGGIRVTRDRIGSIEDMTNHESEAARRLAEKLSGSEAVVNAAGVSVAQGTQVGSLVSANAVFPLILATATKAVGIPRLIHVSSAAVQGRKSVLDSSPQTFAFSPYSSSKSWGEELVLGNGPKQTVVYRPPGVHGRDRPTTKLTVRVASSPLAAYAGDGAANTPQALVENVADAIAFMSVTDLTIPSIVNHPSEGLTVRSYLRRLGDREPKRIPEPAAVPILGAAVMLGNVFSSLSAHSRRLEVLWRGQEQAPSWLTAAGWRPPRGLDGWDKLGVLCRSESAL